MFYDTLSCSLLLLLLLLFLLLLLLKNGVQLPKCDREWEWLNEVFRDTLSDIDFNDFEAAVNHLQETMCTVFSNRYGMTSAQESNENHYLSKTQLKKY